MLHGKCSCGATSFAINALPLDVNYCHCTMCRRATGGAFGILAWCEEKDLTWFGQAASEYRSSSRAVRGFCGACGSPLFLKYDGASEVGIHIGAFDEPQAFIPTHHYGAESRLGWVDIAQNLPAEPCERRSLAQVVADIPIALQRGRSTSAK